MIKSLILDLDDTIFPTNSIDLNLVKPFFDTLEDANDVLTKEDLQKVKQEILEKPFAIVAKNYGFSERMINRSVSALNKVKLNSDLKTYSDYSYLRNLKFEKFLVTTGIRKFQLAKIESLNISNDFDEIFIDDPMEQLGGKLAIFKTLMKKYDYLPKEMLVIGDNPESEIQAGKELGSHTLRIDRNEMTITSDHDAIQSFSEINEWIKIFNIIH